MRSKRGNYAKTGEKIDLLLHLLKGVQYRSLEELSKALDQTTRQTRRMLAVLKKQKYEVTRKPGHKEGWRIYDKVRQKPPLFSHREYMKLVRVLKENNTDLDSDLAGRLAWLVATRLKESMPFYEEYCVIQDAINKGKKVKMMYAPRNNPLNPSFSVGKKGAKRKKICTIAHVDLAKGKAWAWLEKKQKFNQLNLEKMSKVEVSDKNAAVHPAWKEIMDKSDPFGFSAGESPYAVCICLSEFANALFIRQFPDTRPFIKKVRGQYPWCFQATVYDIQPLARFVAGLLHEVKIEGDKKFINDFIAYFMVMNNAFQSFREKALK